MTAGSAFDHDDGAPVSAEDQLRTSALLATVSTRTLLHSLATLYRGNDDAQLIVGALIDRLPAEDGRPG